MFLISFRRSPTRGLQQNRMTDFLEIVGDECLQESQWKAMGEGGGLALLHTTASVWFSLTPRASLR